MEKERTCLFSRTFAGEAAALLPDIDFLAPMYYHSHQSNTIPEDFRSLSAALRLRVLGSVNLEKYVIQGGCRLTGEVNISGAKNAAVAIIPAVILADSPCRLENLPDISDVKTLTYILESMGAKVEYLDRHTVEIDPRPVDTDTVSDQVARRIRASYYFLGALLGRCRRAVVPMPGGCNFGIRPIDQHLKGFSALGCDYSLDNGMIAVSAPRDLHGASVYMDVVTVGATMNIMLAAAKARGLTIIENAAREPHIVDLANFLNTMGADVRGAGTDTIKIHGVQKLRGVTYSIIPDQIEAGTYMVAAAATHGDVTVKNVTPKHLESISAKLVEMGVTVEEGDDTVRVVCDRPLRKCNVKTMPHPGFPTDMQPQITTLLSIAHGTSMVNESVWESNRFKYVDELRPTVPAWSMRAYGRATALSMWTSCAAWEHRSPWTARWPL